MNSIEFGKLCRPLNVSYREIFGVVPCRGDYVCTQEEYLAALKKAVEEKKELTNYVKKREKKAYTDTNIRY